MIRPTDKVHAVLARDERLLEVLATASPTFEKLRNAALRRTMARLVTVEQAAKIAGIDAAALVDRLNAALGGAPAPEVMPAAEPPAQPVAAAIPEDLLAIDPERLVDIDVREDLRAGKEPFRQIMEAARATPEGGVLRVRAIFEPAPLYPVLERQGFPSHFTERIEREDWRVWFRRGEATTKSPTAQETPELDDSELVVLDVRGLEPPEPMMRTLEALAVLPRGKTLVQINVRVPQFLLPKLEERGFVADVREQSPDLVRLFIRHRS